MRPSPKIILALAGLLALVLAVFAIRELTSEAPPSTPEQLVEQAQEAPTVDERERAVLNLAATGPAAEAPLRRLLVESDKPEVRAAAIEGLNQLHAWESMPQILRALEDPSVQVRGRAGAAATRMLGTDFFYRADDPPQKRAAAIRNMQFCYKNMVKSPPPEPKKAEQ